MSSSSPSNPPSHDSHHRHHVNIITILSPSSSTSRHLATPQGQGRVWCARRRSRVRLVLLCTKGAAGSSAEGALGPVLNPFRGSRLVIMPRQGLRLCCVFM
ncbi:hypothetical protein Tco_1480077, partial [Tanacetum coccineum]